MTGRPLTDGRTTADPPAALSRRHIVAGVLGGGVALGAVLAESRPAHADPVEPAGPKVVRGEMPVNVKDYGAKGDGRTDDSAAVQDAVNAATQSGRSIYFPAGTFLSSQPLRSDGSLRLFGEGMWHTTIVCTADARWFDTGTHPPALVVEDMAFDSAGRQRAVFEIDGAATHTFAFRRCRFTNLAGPTTAPAACELINLGNGHFVDCLWHNPAKYAGFGTAVRVQPQTSGNRLTFSGNNRFLWLNNGVRSEPYVRPEHSTAIDSLAIDGAYLDGFWWLLPAGHAGQGSSVSYTATGLTDTTANFGDVPAGRRPNVVNVRAMPVRHHGTVPSGIGKDLADPSADFAAAGVLRGEIVRSDGRWAAVERDPSADVPDRLELEEWLDDQTLLPTSPPAAGKAYTVYGVIIAAATAAGSTTLTVENWRDRHGRDIVPGAGTRYEVLQARPTYLVFTGPGGVLDLSVTNCTFRRGWADLISVRARRASRVVNNRFLDGQESGVVVSDGYSGHLILGNTFTRIGNSAIYVKGSESIVLGNRITGGQTQRPISVANDISLVNGTGNLVAYNLADTGDESQTPHPMIMNQSTSGSSSRNIFAYNQKLGSLGEADIVFSGKGNTDNHVVGSRSVAYRAAATGQLLEMIGTGSPEGRVTASPGSTFRRTDGGAGSTFYVKQSGTGVTGWTSGADGSGGGQPQLAIATKKADSTVTGTALTDDPDLSLAVAADSTYLVEGHLLYLADPSVDVRLRWRVPAGAALTWNLNSPAGGANSAASTTINRAVASATSTPNMGGTGSDAVAMPSGVLTSGDSSGSMQLQFAPSHGDSSAQATLRQGSWIRLTKIS